MWWGLAHFVASLLAGAALLWEGLLLCVSFFSFYNFNPGSLSDLIFLVYVIVIPWGVFAAYMVFSFHRNMATFLLSTGLSIACFGSFYLWVSGWGEKILH